MSAHEKICALGSPIMVIIDLFFNSGFEIFASNSFFRIFSEQTAPLPRQGGEIILPGGSVLPLKKIIFDESNVPGLQLICNVGKGYISRIFLSLPAYSDLTLTLPLKPSIR